MSHPQPPTDAERTEILRRCAAGEGRRTIATALGWSEYRLRRVLQALQEAGAPLRGKYAAIGSLSAAELNQLYADPDGEQLSLSALAKRYGCHPQTARRTLERAGIAIRDPETQWKIDQERGRLVQTTEGAKPQKNQALVNFHAEQLAWLQARGHRQLGPTIRALIDAEMAREKTAAADLLAASVRFAEPYLCLHAVRVEGVLTVYGDYLEVQARTWPMSEADLEATIALLLARQDGSLGVRALPGGTIWYTVTCAGCGAEQILVEGTGGPIGRVGPLCRECF